MSTDTARLPTAYLTIEEVAELLRVPVRTLYHWRNTGTGPTAYRIGRYLRYRTREVEAWVDEQASTATPPSARGRTG